MAASKTRVRVEGVREVQRALKALEASTADLTAVHREVAAELVPGVGLRSPRRTGALAASWSAKSTKTRARIVSTKVYAGVIEYGWPARSIRAAKMVRQTIESSQRQIVASYERAIERLGAKAGFEVRP